MKQHHNDLKDTINNFSKLEQNWDSYQANSITYKSIKTALIVLNKLSEENGIYVFPMRTGGIQFELGDFKEIEILDENVIIFEYNSDYDIIKKTKWDIIKEVRIEKLNRIINEV